MRFANSTIDSFREHIARAKDPIAGGVAVAALSAGLAMGLVAMTLQVTSRRKAFSGDRGRLKILLNAANKESRRLIRYADEDIATYQRYRESLRSNRGLDRAKAGILETPLNAARAAASGLDLCVEARSWVPASVVSDVCVAAELLAGSVRAMLLTLDVNLQQLPPGSQLRRSMSKERRELERRALKQLDRVLGR